MVPESRIEEMSLASRAPELFAMYYATGNGGSIWNMEEITYDMKKEESLSRNETIDSTKP